MYGLDRNGTSRNAFHNNMAVFRVVRQDVGASTQTRAHTHVAFPILPFSYFHVCMPIITKSHIGLSALQNEIIFLITMMTHTLVVVKLA